MKPNYYQLHAYCDRYQIYIYEAHKVNITITT